ncbi:MAG: hypothetical protein H0T53_14970 [Herpetosiphonaceae bacterium]|nr:hypothetical protein [Herpetosiphonaceae bacterium]
MYKQRHPVRFSTLLTIILLILAACGGAAVPATSPPPPATEAVVAAEDPTAEPEVAEDPTAEPEVAEDPTPEAPRGDTPDIGASGEGSFDTTGVYVADLGFRPDYDGFSFPNYGGEPDIVNLTANDVWRMFGDQACAYIDAENCTLTPAGDQWMESVNSSMNGGHCEGMAVLSNLFYTKKLSLTDYGVESTADFQIEGNELLQREIAYWFTTQATQPARQGIVQQTPSGVVNTLLNAFAAGPDGSETYAVGFYKRDMSGGHAVTPYAVEDRGDGIYWIMIYDNNYPGAARAIEVDTNNDTWLYSGSTNPAEPADDYEGDAGTFTLELAAIEPRLGMQECPFCDDSGTGGATNPNRGTRIAQTTTTTDSIAYNQVILEGNGDLLITDLEGRSFGFKDGVFVNEIPGARSNTNKFGVDVWNVDHEPVYYLPTDIDFTIEIDGTRLTEPTTSTVTFIGPGYVLEVSDIFLEPGQVDVLDIAPDGSLLSYRTTSAETPVMLVGIETDAADYLFVVQGYEMEEGEALNLSLNTTEGWLSLDSIDNAAPALYSLYMVKYDDNTEQIFGTDEIALEPDDVVYVDYLLWPGNGQPMALDVDYGGDGSVDETLQIDDVTDELVEEEN